MQLKELNGIGEKTEKIFQRAGVNTVEDLLSYYPRYYDTFESLFSFKIWKQTERRL